MLIHANPHTGKAVAIAGPAHIVITIDVQAHGSLVSLCAFDRGRADAAYAPLTEEQLLSKELPKLLAELRAQLAEPRQGD
jgi:hypothetical protein